MSVARPYIMIAGPTASGKSQLAIDLAKQCGGAIINADSMQLYADLSILTARPHSREMQDIPHHLFGVCDACLLYTSPSPRDLSTSRMPSSA